MKKLILLGLVVIGVGGSFNGCANQAPTVHQEILDEKEKGCNEGNAVLCVLAGNNYRAGRNVKKDYFKAAEYYQKACDSGEAKEGHGSSIAHYQQKAKGCYYLASMYHEGMGVKKDKVKERKYFKKSCDGKYSYVKGCKRYNKLK
jgi:TPR repeat protein